MNLEYTTNEFFYDTSFEDYPIIEDFIFKFEILQFKLIKYFRENTLHYTSSTYHHIINSAHYFGFKVIKQDYKSSIENNIVKHWIIVQLCWVDKGGVNFYKFLDFDEDVLRTYQFLPSSLAHLQQH